MNIKIARYGNEEIEYDADAPCWSCGLAVVEASMEGTVICPWCDMGRHRDGTKWTYDETIQFGNHYKESVKKYYHEKGTRTSQDSSQVISRDCEILSG